MFLLPVKVTLIILLSLHKETTGRQPKKKKGKDFKSSTNLFLTTSSFRISTRLLCKVHSYLRWFSFSWSWTICTAFISAGFDVFYDLVSVYKLTLLHFTSFVTTSKWFTIQNDCSYYVRPYGFCVTVLWGLNVRLLALLELRICNSLTIWTCELFDLTLVFILLAVFQ